MIKPDSAPAAFDNLSIVIARRVIEKTGPDRPADAALRSELANSKQLSRGEARRASRATFSFYRWQRWLDSKVPLRPQITRAIELSDAYDQDPGRFPDDELIARAVPDWIRSEVEVTADWARALQREPTLWLRTKRGTAAVLASRLGVSLSKETSPLPDAIHYEGEHDLFRDPGFHAGEFEIQDISSQAVGLICAPKPGETWWDACAGEGGKTLHLSDLMQNKGLIWASDRADWRLKKLKLRAGRAKCFNYRTASWDGGEKPPTKTKFDGVLIDAPCSGVGTWQRNPHARWTTTAKDVAELAEVQKRLLANAARNVKDGGRLIYSVCTLTKSETTAVAEAFSQDHPEFEPLRMTNPFPGIDVSSAQLCLWPQQTGGNGMFIATWRRVRSA